MQVTTCAISRPGDRDHNEDAYGDAELMAGRCIVVADGAGGHRGGALASRLVVDTTLLQLAAAPVWTSDAMLEALDAAGAALHERQSREPLLKEMSSTVALLCIEANSGTARCAHLGDTRILFFRGKEVLQLTRDHSVLQSLTDAGLVSGQGTAKFDRTTLYAAVGAEGDTRPAIGEPITLAPGDAFLLCTDGAWDSVRVDTMLALLDEADSVEQWVERVCAAVESAAKPNQDNYTAVGVWLGTRGRQGGAAEAGPQS